MMIMGLDEYNSNSGLLWLLCVVGCNVFQKRAGGFGVQILQ